jgi:hypothetical protein
LQEEYGYLKNKIEDTEQNSLLLIEEFAIFSNTQQRNHSTIIKVISRDPSNGS